MTPIFEQVRHTIRLQKNDSKIVWLLLAVYLFGNYASRSKATIDQLGKLKSRRKWRCRLSLKFTKRYFSSLSASLRKYFLFFSFFSFFLFVFLNWTLIVQVKLRKFRENGIDQFRFWETRICHIYRSHGCKHDNPRFVHFLTRDIIQRNKSHFLFYIGKQF